MPTITRGIDRLQADGGQQQLSLVVPVSFCANVVRVIILVLVTYRFGDEAGQGFVHGFAGMVLFAVALLFIMGLDRALAAVLPRRWAD